MSWRELFQINRFTKTLYTNSRNHCEVDKIALHAFHDYNIKVISTMSWRHMGECRYSSTILDFGTKWTWAVSFMLWPFYPWGNSYGCPLIRRRGWPQIWSGRWGLEKNPLPLLGIEHTAHHYTEWVISDMESGNKQSDKCATLVGVQGYSICVLQILKWNKTSTTCQQLSPLVDARNPTILQNPTKAYFWHFYFKSTVSLN
jgi:hypothetical protein